MPMVSELFRAVVFAAECEDLYEEVHVQPFSAGLLAMSSLLAFWALNAFAPKPAFLSFARLARLVMPSVFFVRWHIPAALLAVADFAFQARFGHFAKALKIGARAVAI